MTPANTHLKIIVLAAGKSERFKGIKLLANLENGDSTITLIEHVLTQLSAALNQLAIDKKNLFVATGRYHQQLLNVIGEQFSLNFCQQAHLGLGHTIAQSVEQTLLTDKLTSHIMIVLADQVALNVNDYNNLITESFKQPNKLVCATADGELMPPAIFPRDYFSALMKLTGDKGAKSILYTNREQCTEVILPNAAADIDTQQDLVNWHQQL